MNTFQSSNKLEGSESKLTIRVPESTKSKLDLLSKQSNISVSRAVTEMIESILSGENSSLEIPISNTKTTDESLETLRAISKQFNTASITLENEMKEATTQASYSVSLNAKSLSTEVENTKLILRNGSKDWSQMIENVADIQEFFGQIKVIARDLTSAKNNFDSDFVYFKRQLVNESHGYRKKLDAFAVKHYLFGALFLGISTLGVIIALKYFL